MGFWDIFKRNKQMPEVISNIAQIDRPSKEEAPADSIRVQDVHEVDAVLGITYEERQKMYEDARKELDSEWESELENKHMAKSRELRLAIDKQLERVDLDKLLTVKPVPPRPLSLSEILFLEYMDGRPASMSGVAGYWVYSYELNIPEVLEAFFSYGYLKFADAPFAISKCTVQNLKELLSNNNLPVSGKKEILINRILENIPQDKLEKQFANKYLQLTDQGKALIASYSHLKYFHANSNCFGISLDEADAIHREHPDFSNYQIVEEIMFQRMKSFKEDKCYGLYRNCLMALSLTHRHAGNTIEEAKYDLQCCFMDISGYDNTGTLNPHICGFAPGLISHLKNLYKDNYERLHQDFFGAVASLDIPKNKGMDTAAWEKLLSSINELNS